MAESSPKVPGRPWLFRLAFSSLSIAVVITQNSAAGLVLIAITIAKVADL